MSKFQKSQIVFLLLFVFLCSSSLVFSQDTIKLVKKEPKWYDKLSLRGYTQIRYNRLLETNPDLNCEQCDRSWGNNGGLFLRRGRLIISGDVSDRVYVYIQPDFASSASATGLNYMQMRDAYFDLSLDKDKEFRIRLGQSKIPFGFENMQSSQNRLPLDRNDALNSALSNERDIAALFYWAPKEIRERFRYLVSSGLKGSGDYGVIGGGVFNGQTANRPEANNELHYVARASYPFKLNNGQIIETGIQGYKGKFVPTKNSKTLGANEFRDERVAATLCIYPQPFGILAEWNTGTGPEFNPSNNTIENKRLEGGFATLNYQLKMGDQILFPFIRTQYYVGGKKHEIDARKYRVREHEFGVEWQPTKSFELVVMYTVSDRVFEDFSKPNNHQRGNLLRLQAQFNY